jgi:hypothetical protein
MTPYSLVNVYRRFGEIYCLYIQARRVSQSTRMQEESISCLTRYQTCGWPRQLNQQTDWLWATQQDLDFKQWQERCCFSLRTTRSAVSMCTQPPIRWLPGALSLELSGRNMKLPTSAVKNYFWAPHYRKYNKMIVNGNFQKKWLSGWHARILHKWLEKIVPDLDWF